MTVSQRLAELGIELPEVVPPVAAYVPAKAHGDLVFTAGQLPIVSGTLLATGKVGEGDGLVAAADAQSTHVSAHSTPWPPLRPPSGESIGSPASSRSSGSWHPSPSSPDSPA